MASPVLEPKIEVRLLPHVVMSYHVNQPTQARAYGPRATRTKPTSFVKR